MLKLDMGFLFSGGLSRKISARCFWLTTVLCLATQAIAPPLVQAYIARVDVNIDRLPDESYENVLSRAEAIARTATQRSFDQDIFVTDVSVYVNVQNQGAIAPVLLLEVSRTEWKKLPDPHRWVTPFETAKSLLLWKDDGTNNETVSQPIPPENNPTKTNDVQQKPPGEITSPPDSPPETTPE